MRSLDLPRPLAFVLSGGAALGALQVGMLDAALEHGLRPDLVVGASVGALNGAVLCEGPGEAVDRLAGVWRNLRRQAVFPWTVSANLRALAGRGTHLFSSSRLDGLIRASLGADEFCELPVPLTVVATDALTGHPVLLTHGPLSPALLASAAIPGLFPPVVRDGRLLVDGGLAQNVPLQPALGAGAASILVLDAAGFCHRSLPARNLVETLVFSSSLLLRQQVTCDLAAVSARVPVLYPPGPCLVGRSPMDFSRSADLIELGRTHTAAFLDQIELSGPGLYGHPHHHAEDEMP